MSSFPVTPPRTASCPTEATTTPASVATVAIRPRRSSFDSPFAAGGAGAESPSKALSRIFFAAASGGGAGGSAASREAVAISKDGVDRFSPLPSSIKEKIFSYLSGFPLKDAAEHKFFPDDKEHIPAIKVERSWQLCQLSRAFYVDYTQTRSLDPLVQAAFHDYVSIVTTYQKPSQKLTYKEMLKIRHIYSRLILMCPERYSQQTALAAAVHYELYGLKKLQMFSAERKIISTYESDATCLTKEKDLELLGAFKESRMDSLSLSRGLLDLAQRIVRLMEMPSWAIKDLKLKEPEMAFDSTTLFPFALNDPKKLIQHNPDDKTVVELILQIRPQLFQFASESIRGAPSSEDAAGKEWLIRALISQAEWLKEASEEVRAAHPSLLKYAHPDMRKDPYVIHKATELDPTALAFCSEVDFKGQEKWLEKLIRKRPAAFKYASRFIHVTKAFVAELLFKHPRLILDLEDPLAVDRDLVLIALDKDPSLYKKLKEELRVNQEIAEFVVTKDPNLYICLPEEMKEIPKIAHLALSNDGKLYRFLPDSLLGDETLAVTAVKKTPSLAGFIEMQGYFSAEGLLEAASKKASES